MERTMLRKGFTEFHADSDGHVFGKPTSLEPKVYNRPIVGGYVDTGLVVPALASNTKFTFQQLEAAMSENQNP